MHRTRVGQLYALLGVTLFAGSIPMTKLAVDGFAPIVTATARAVMAGCIALPLLLIGRVSFPAYALRRQLIYTTMGAVFGWPILIALALQRSSSAHTAVIAAFMPLMTALIAVVRTSERAAPQFWWAAGTGTAALVAFSVSRGSGSSGGDIVADLFVVGAVVASSWCYVEGAGLTAAMPGWQVISWVVVIALPITIPVTVWMLVTHPHQGAIPGHAWVGLAYIGIVSMYFGFWAWYRGLALAGVTKGSSIQQLQALMTLGLSAWFLGERVEPSTLAAALVVVASVVWAQRSRIVPPVPTEMD
jgi:drug/metabolite transporter (DMT)-like permease